MLLFTEQSATPELPSAPSSDRLKLAPRKTRPNDDEFQNAMLQGVSRTFALTIPQLPPALCRVVSNAYLLCRIVDTIEDEPALSAVQKSYFCQQFLTALNSSQNAERFSRQLGGLLSSQTIPAEQELIRNVGRVTRITRSFSKPQRQALEHCVRTMAKGMAEFQLKGDVETLNDLDEYCYYVAGVVGQMLTSLFCIYSPQIAKNRDALMHLAISFGQGLQMTNILKDVWEDYQRGACWLPRRVFAHEGFDLNNLTTDTNREGFQRSIRYLIGIAHRHLRNALSYTLLIPKEETGVRNFCLWGLGMAVLTLRKLNTQLSYTSEVKISRRSVKATILATRFTFQNKALLSLLFRFAAWPLPLGSPSLGWAVPEPAQSKRKTKT
jgi:farnesyl-diphosphate farnesyltransferase